jgi:hypothetical protein
LPALQALEDFDSAGETAALGAEIAKALIGRILQLAEPLALLVFFGQMMASILQPSLEGFEDLTQLLKLQVNRIQVLGRLLRFVQQALALPAQILDLGFVANRIVLKMSGLAHLFQVGGLIGLDLVLEVCQPPDGGSELAVQRIHLLMLLATLGFGGLGFGSGSGGGRGERGHPLVQLRHPGAGGG